MDRPLSLLRLAMELTKQTLETELDTVQKRNYYLCNWNLANSPADEQRKDLRFGERFATILKRLRGERCNGMCMLTVQEVRTCMDYGSKESDSLSVGKIVWLISQCLNMVPVACPNNDNLSSLWKVTFYDPKVLMCTSSATIRGGGPESNPLNGSKFRYSFLCCKFYFVEMGKGDSLLGNYLGGQEFAVVNIHSPVGIGERMQYCHQLLDFVSSQCADIPTICVGDFNTIPDIGGSEQMELLTSTLTNRTNPGITFIGFPGDGDAHGPYQSALDKVMTNNCWDNTHPFSECSLENEFMNVTDTGGFGFPGSGIRASDHFLMRIKLWNTTARPNVFS